jgi:hypothetical protein
MGGHDEDHTDYSASKADMKKHKIPICWRDQCAGLLIPLNVCRKETWYNPLECTHERHMYEKCQHREYQKRIDAMDEHRRQREKL